MPYLSILVNQSSGGWTSVGECSRSGIVYLYHYYYDNYYDNYNYNYHYFVNEDLKNALTD